MTVQKKFGVPLLAAVMVAGIGMGAFALAGAQTASAADAATTSAVSMSTTGTAPHLGSHGHAPIGQDGIVANISGTTIAMTEEADEGGTTYTVDASNATVTKDGTASTLSNIAVGDKIFVKGVATGTTVVASNVDDGRAPHMGGHRDINPDNTDTQVP